MRGCSGSHAHRRVRRALPAAVDPPTSGHGLRLRAHADEPVGGAPARRRLLLVGRRPGELPHPRRGVSASSWAALPTALRLHAWVVLRAVRVAVRSTPYLGIAIVAVAAGVAVLGLLPSSAAGCPAAANRRRPDRRRRGRRDVGGGVLAGVASLLEQAERPRASATARRPVAEDPVEDVDPIRGQDPGRATGSRARDGRSRDAGGAPGVPSPTGHLPEGVPGAGDGSEGCLHPRDHRHRGAHRAPVGPRTPDRRPGRRRGAGRRSSPSSSSASSASTSSRPARRSPGRCSAWRCGAPTRMSWPPGGARPKATIVAPDRHAGAVGAATAPWARAERARAAASVSSSACSSPSWPSSRRS